MSPAPASRTSHLGSRAKQAEDQAAAFETTRERTLALVEPLNDEQLARVIDPLLSPLVWDLGHIANFEQRWLLGAEGTALDSIYNPFEQPRDIRGELPLLTPEQCFNYMSEVRAAARSKLDELDPFVIELVIQHEQQHNETMLQLLQQLDDYRPPQALTERFVAPSRRPQHIRLRENAARAYRPAASSGLADWVAFPGGRYAIGTDPKGDDDFVYDNERGCHDVQIDAFEIATRPVNNAEFQEWIELGGYEKPHWWSDQGLAWLDETRSEMPLGWSRQGDQFFFTAFGETTPIDPEAPVCHISWFEADAYARAHAARLPTEFEWEVAASYDPRHPQAVDRRRFAWGDSAWSPGAANLDQLAFGTLPAGATDHGFGLIDMLGQVWEWTSSEFTAYPGFEPFCYREYSAPFFDAGYRVLRGGSWATGARSVDNRFRNWDHPQRRQIFSGVRLARNPQ